MNTKFHSHRLIILITGAALLCFQQVAMSGDAPKIAPQTGQSANIRLFNGTDLTGWIGDPKHWSVEDGEIVGRNTEPLSPSTYLVTEVDFSDFRLIFEFKLVQSEMHSGIALWGKVDPEKGNPFTYAGPLVMFPSNYGIWDLYGREKIHDNAEKARSVGHQHDWNRIEILAQSNRIRFALNGELVSDWRDPEPDRLQPGPIGLQLHWNKVPQEVRFRNLRLETFPLDRMVTAKSDQSSLFANVQKMELNVAPNTPDLWTSYPAVAIPHDILTPIIHSKSGIRTMGIRAEDRDSYYAILQKARQVKLATLKKAASEFRRKRQQVAFNGKYKDLPAYEFPDFVDLYDEPELYHGKLVTLTGHLRKLSSFKPDDNPYGIKEDLWEAWLYDPHGQNHPAVVISTSRDLLGESTEAQLKSSGEFVTDHVSITGYFFKEYGYEGQDAIRFAPMLIAQRIEYHPPPESLNPFDLSLNAKLQLLIAAMAVLMVGRFSWKIWKSSQTDDDKREAVLEIASNEDAEPTFDNIIDNGGIPPFPKD